MPKQYDTPLRLTTATSIDEAPLDEPGDEDGDDSVHEGSPSETDGAV